MYIFSSQVGLLRDKYSEDQRVERLKFHLEAGDYFPMLATILGFVEETVTKCHCEEIVRIAPMESQLMKNTRKDLMFLHQNYHIVPK